MDGLLKRPIALNLQVCFFEQHLKDIFQHLDWHIIEDDDIYMTIIVSMEYDTFTKQRANALALLFTYISNAYSNIASCV